MVASECGDTIGGLRQAAHIPHRRALPQSGHHLQQTGHLARNPTVGALKHCLENIRDSTRSCYAFRILAQVSCVRGVLNAGTTACTRVRTLGRSSAPPTRSKNAAKELKPDAAVVRRVVADLVRNQEVLPASPNLSAVTARQGPGGSIPHSIRL